MRFQFLLWAAASAFGVAGAEAQNFDAATVFGVRPAIEDIGLSPDGRRIAFISPDAQGQGSTVFAAEIGSEAKPKGILHTSGKPTRLRSCNWVSLARLVCSTYSVGRAAWRVGGVAQRYALDVDGKNLKEISAARIIDWLPNEQEAVLVGGRSGVWRLDTRTMKTRLIEPGRNFACDYRSDGRGVTRIMGICRYDGAGMQLPAITYLFRKKSGGDWQALSDYDTESFGGFYPAAVDPDLDIVYGFSRRNGRFAIYQKALDGTDATKLIFAHDQVDVDSLVSIGRQGHPVGVRFITDVSHTVFFDPVLEKLRLSLSRALPHQPTITIIDSSLDESKLLLFASGDDDPGTYYLLDRATRQMTQLLRERPQLDGHQLAKVRPIEYVASDGTKIPAYLTLPTSGSGKNLPTIVMPHGGPASRDEWGFDWLSQYFVSQGFAVLQPQFRGSSGYGEQWFQNNGFRSWRVAIGDVLDAGRWLIGQGIADPQRLAVVGWSYGGYAALQSAAVDPQLFKAVIAIAPVTDLAQLKTERRGWSNSKMQQDFVGDGPHVREGSPTQNATRIKAPVLIFHAENDANVSVAESRLMDAKLTEANVPHELVVWPALDHRLEDSTVRADMLRKSEAFLRRSMGM